MKELYPALKYIYSLMHASGRLDVMDHLSVSRIDYCSFGNSHPFRVRIINRLNDNYDHFYVKRADASPVYGLELEHILSPNRISYFTDDDTLIEEHIPGLPGDVFVNEYLDGVKFNQTRISKEFVKFNERCFVRLLGDMRSYNFVVDIPLISKVINIVSGPSISISNLMKENCVYICLNFLKKTIIWFLWE
jgi:hypothetical protein